MVTFFYGGLNDCFTFNFVGDERPFRQRVEVSIDLLADEVCHALRIVQPYDSAIILHTEKERAAFRIGIGADALQPVADLLPLQLTLEIVGRTLAINLCPSTLMGSRISPTNLATFSEKGQK